MTDHARAGPVDGASAALAVPALSMVGIACVLLYDATSAAKEVYAGHLVQRVDPFALAALCFAVAAVVFNLIRRISARAVAPPLPSERPVRLIVALNVTTMMSWLSIYYALRYTQPAIVGAISGGVGPLVILIMGRWIGQERSTTRSEIVSCIGILIGTAVLSWAAVAGTSAMGAVLTGDAVTGLVVSAVAGSFATASTFWSKRLSDRGWPPVRIMAHRFYLLVGVAGLIGWGTGTIDRALFALWPAILIIAGIGIIVPLYALQVGIRRCHPFVVTVLIGVCPIFTLGFELFDDRLDWSAISALGVCVLVAAGLIGVIGKR